MECCTFDEPRRYLLWFGDENDRASSGCELANKNDETIPVVPWSALNVRYLILGIDSNVMRIFNKDEGFTVYVIGYPSGVEKLYNELSDNIYFISCVDAITFDMHIYDQVCDYGVSLCNFN